MDGRTHSLALGLVLSATVLAALSGCVGYTTYSLNPQDAKVLHSPNSLGVQDVVIASTRWILERYPPSGHPDPLRDPAKSATSEAFALNLPYGLSEESSRVILKNLAPGAQPMLEENAKLPIYHIAYIRIRGDEADVHAFRPVFALGPKPSGETLYQEMRLKLQGGLRQWRVVYGLNWTPGSGEPPPIHYIKRPREPHEYANPPRQDGKTQPPARAPSEADWQQLEPGPTDPASEAEGGLEIGNAGVSGSPGVAEPLIDLPFNPLWDTPPSSSPR